MVCISTLPLECLNIILQILLDGSNVADLATLLRVSKHLASVALPYLYANPFRTSFIKAPFENEEIHTNFLLSRMLLGHVYATASTDPSADRPLLPPSKVLLLGLPLEIPEKTSPLDYLACIRHLSLRVLKSNKKHPWSKDFEHYIQANEFEEFCRSGRPPLQLGKDILPIVLSREVNWFLAIPILGQLRSLTISVAYVERYLTVIDHLSNLESVLFLLDDAFHRDELEHDDGTAPLREEEPWRPTVDFVKAHTELFKGRLTTVSFHRHYIDLFQQQPCPKDIQLGIFQSLPPMRNPTLITNNNWIQILAHPLQIDFGHVQEISSVHRSEHSLGKSCFLQPILQRCRALKTLHISTLGKNSFQWAVQEKRLKEASNKGVSTGQGVSTPDATQMSCWQNGLIPISDVRLEEEVEIPLTNEVDDIANAFSQTLSKLVVNTLHTTPDIESTLFGQGWEDLPVLRTLALNTMRNRLIIDSRLLQHCPNVVDVELKDKGVNYRCKDIVTCQPAHLSKLKNLHLTGWSALTFHPTTLHSTTRLKSLKIAIKGFGNIVRIPPVQELNRSFGIQDTATQRTGAGSLENPTTVARPIWTWDWDLPNLTELELSAEFAFRFEFRMLHGCPALRSLELNIETLENQHTRVISEADLFSPPLPANLTPMTAATGARQKIVCPSLQILVMAGEWEIDRELLPKFLLGMFPNVERYSVRACKTLALGCLVKVVRHLPNKIAELSLAINMINKDKMIEYGAFPMNEPKIKGKELLPVKIHLSHREFGLLKDVDDYYN
ncbi:hypothetical protein BGZ95_000172 [Linnemannia exigua]|uniref:Uncharacterized protein n=1 Tax=Linnemannia exigua TaxID=604196 RepID=A0AAD4DAR6_9FUNG|nr:hypothetical protein BGZ95_000172 [Linnemannia exigua]